MSYSVTVLGANGMLGRYVSEFFSRQKEIGRVIRVTRKDFDVATVPDSLLRLYIKDSDMVINCAGIINTRVGEVGIKETIQVNSVFPHQLANLCEKENVPCTHITTDCVYDGVQGGYTETSPHSPIDLYGKTKSLGEPENCSVIRTSIIGEEIGQRRSLVEWFKSQVDGVVTGFENHWWNGVTCLELANLIYRITLEPSTRWQGVHHVFSPGKVTKMRLLSLINYSYDLGIIINPGRDSTPIDRTMDSIYEHPRITNPIGKQIAELKEFQL